MAKLVLLLAMLGVWGLAAWLWPGLPERIPMHFDFAGRPDGWVEKSVLVWFGLPALATAVSAVLGLLLPIWMVHLARTNSRWLNVPRKDLFVQLPVEARVRAVAAPARWLTVLGCLVQGLFGWIVFGSSRVAVGAWDVLPATPTFVGVGAIVLCAIGLAFAGAHAVKREFANRAK